MIDKSQGDLNSSNSKYFPLCPPWSISVALLLFEVSTSIFCVQIRPLHSLHTVVFEFLLFPSYDPYWQLLSCALPGWFQSSNHFSKPLPRVSCADPATPFAQDHCFRNFSQHAHAPTLKTPLAPSPACLNHSITFESLLLESICPHPSLRTPQQDSLQTLGLAMTALPGLASAALSGLAAAGTRLLGRISSSL